VAAAVCGALWAWIWRRGTAKRRALEDAHVRTSARAARLATVISASDLAADKRLGVDLKSVEDKINKIVAANTDDVPKLIDEEWPP